MPYKVLNLSNLKATLARLEQEAENIRRKQREYAATGNVGIAHQIACRIDSLEGKYSEVMSNASKMPGGPMEFAWINLFGDAGEGGI